MPQPCDDFLEAVKKLYQPNGLLPQKIIISAESQDYHALSFELGRKLIQFRAAKITPKKIGHFASLWQRVGGITLPHTAEGPVDFFVISVRDVQGFGQFIFPKELLVAKKIFSLAGIGGKRGIRIYAPWLKGLNPQALKTQRWQKDYFVSIAPHTDQDNQATLPLRNLIGMLTTLD